MATTRINATTTARAQQPQSPAQPRLPRGFTADSVAAYQRVAPKFEDGFLACAQLPFSRDNNFAPVRQAALRLGMTEQAPGYFSHADGSWLARLTDGRIERGQGNKAFQGVPVGPDRLGGVQPQMIHFKLAVADSAVLALKSLDAKGVETLTAKGFKQTAPHFFVHRDQSFVAFAGGTKYFGAQNQVFSAAPSYEGLAQVQPTVDNVLCAAALWNLPKDPAAAKQYLLKEGFRETRNNYFALDELWVVFAGAKVHMGSNEEIFAKPPGIESMPKTKSGPEHGWLAIAKTADIKADTPGLGRKMAALKFKSYSGGLYEHADGSWLVVQGNKIFRGATDVVFSDVPKAPKKGDFPRYTSLPSRTWDWYQKNTALGRTPIIGSAQQAKAELPKLGYKAPSSGTKWVHPDGSWFDVGIIRPGFQQWHIGQLPFNNRIAG